MVWVRWRWSRWSGITVAGTVAGTAAATATGPAAGTAVTAAAGAGRGGWCASSGSKQREALWSIAGEVREAVIPLKQAGREGRDVVIQAIAAADFDRARVEEFAARQEAAIGQARSTIVDALDRAHTVLTSEQRTKLRELLARMGFGDGGGEGGGGTPFGAGPYRTASL